MKEVFVIRNLSTGKYSDHVCVNKEHAKWFYNQLPLGNYLIELIYLSDREIMQLLTTHVGKHFFFLNYFLINNKLPDYRRSDGEYFNKIFTLAEQLEKEGKLGVIFIKPRVRSL